MPMTISCPTCHAPFSIQEEFAGRKIRCSGCSTILMVPTPAMVAAANRPPSTAGPPSEKRLKKKKKVKTEAPSKTAFYVVIGVGVTMFLAVIVLAVTIIPFGSMFAGAKELEVIDVYTAINGMGYHTTGERFMQSDLTALCIPGRRKIIITRSDPAGGYLMVRLKIPYDDVTEYFPGSYAASRPHLTHGTIWLDAGGERVTPYFHNDDNDASKGYQLDYAPRGNNPQPLESYLGPSKQFDWTHEGELQEGSDGMIFRGKRGLVARIRIGDERQDGLESGGPFNGLAGRKIFRDRDGLVSGAGGFIHVSWNKDSGGWIVSDDLEMPNEIGRNWNVICFFPRPKARNTEGTLTVLKKSRKIKLP